MKSNVGFIFAIASVIYIAVVILFGMNVRQYVLCKESTDATLIDVIEERHKDDDGDVHYTYSGKYEFYLDNDRYTTISSTDYSYPGTVPENVVVMYNAHNPSMSYEVGGFWGDIIVLGIILVAGAVGLAFFWKAWR